MKQRDDARREAVRRWMRYAESDIKMAKLVLAHAEILAAKGAFHAQQAAELGLKALLIDREIDFPLTHNLAELVSIIEKSETVPESVRESEALTVFAADKRYPGLPDETTRDELADAIRIAEQTLEWVEQNLSEERS